MTARYTPPFSPEALLSLSRLAADELRRAAIEIQDDGQADVQRVFDAAAEALLEGDVCPPVSSRKCREAREYVEVLKRAFQGHLESLEKMLVERRDACPDLVEMLIIEYSDLAYHQLILDASMEIEFAQSDP